MIIIAIFSILVLLFYYCILAVFPLLDNSMLLFSLFMLNLVAGLMLIKHPKTKSSGIGLLVGLGIAIIIFATAFYLMMSKLH